MPGLRVHLTGSAAAGCDHDLLAKAHACAGEAHPDTSSVLFHGARERTVVNHFVANGGEPADAFEPSAAQQNAAPCRARSARFRVGDPARRIEHQKKIEKWRNQQALGKCLRLQEDRVRYRRP